MYSADITLHTGISHLKKQSLYQVGAEILMVLENQIQ